MENRGNNYLRLFSYVTTVQIALQPKPVRWLPFTSAVCRLWKTLHLYVCREPRSHLWSGYPDPACQNWKCQYELKPWKKKHQKWYHFLIIIGEFSKFTFLIRHKCVTIVKLSLYWRYQGLPSRLYKFSKNNNWS